MDCSAALCWIHMVVQGPSSTESDELELGKLSGNDVSAFSVFVRNINGG
jgi:hypothetical protein